MNASPRDTILNRLKSADPRPISERPQMPLLGELCLDRAQVIEKFIAQFTAQGGNAHRVADEVDLLDTLAELLAREKVTHAMATTDSVLAPLQLTQWGRRSGIRVTTPSDFADRQSYTRAVFDDVQAGITGADFAIAESGTLILAHEARMARLVSLAPILHIAVVPVSHVVPVYESAVDLLFTRDRRPSQITLITGPSMTADIQGKPFKGMHGPQKLAALIVG